MSLLDVVPLGVLQRDRGARISVSCSKPIHTKAIALSAPIRAHGSPITNASN